MWPTLPEATDRPLCGRWKISRGAGPPVVPALAVVDTQAAQDVAIRCALDTLGDNLCVATFGEIDKRADE
jgi:hypothetical protein